jgi:type I restriction enzyme R subunit
MKDNLSKNDIKKIKEVSKELIEKIKELLHTMDHPFDQEETKATIIVMIRDTLWNELPESYPDESINHYKDAVYNYFSLHHDRIA